MSWTRPYSPDEATGPSWMILRLWSSVTHRASLTLSAFILFAASLAATAPARSVTPEPHHMIHVTASSYPADPIMRELAAIRASRSMTRTAAPVPRTPRKIVHQAPRTGPRAAYSPGPVSHYPLTAVQAYAASLVGPAQMSCLLPLWNRESHWDPFAHNPTSSAFGVAQLLTETSRDALVQVRDGLHYIAGRYGTSCKAWAHSLATGWY